MRLINCKTLRLEEFFGSNIPRYAILSHTWGNEEVSFADFTLNQAAATTKEGYQKIHFTCTQALQDGVEYSWVDTCCIDKSSSAELSEAINSMFAWYREADQCYAYLSDVSVADFVQSFPKSRWFTRGWTLQELIAPGDVVFYDPQWNTLGKRSKHARLISEITLIDARMFRYRWPSDVVPLDSFCVAKRMSWASTRETTRVEDIAYCLLGILNINMPLLYGEGERAFLRLQEELIRNLHDDSILAWGLDAEMRNSLGLVPTAVATHMQMGRGEGSALARSPKDFKNCGGLECTGRSDSAFTMTNLGLEMELPLVPIGRNSNDPFSVPDNIYAWIGLLSCSLGTSSAILGITLWPAGAGSGSSKMVQRGQAYPYCTLVVGPRAAALSKVEKVTIIRDEKDRAWTRNYYYGFRHVVVNMSEALRGRGYHITNATGVNIEGRFMRPNHTIWNPVTMVLKIQDENIPEVLLSIPFEEQWSEPGADFTVFMRTDNRRAVLREGLSFSEEQKRDINDYLEVQQHHDDANFLVIADSSGHQFHKVTVEIKENRVYRLRIYQVNVDAVQLEDVSSMKV